MKLMSSKGQLSIGSTRVASSKCSILLLSELIVWSNKILTLCHRSYYYWNKCSVGWKLVSFGQAALCCSRAFGQCAVRIVMLFRPISSISWTCITYKMMKYYWQGMKCRRSYWANENKVTIIKAGKERKHNIRNREIIITAVKAAF